MSLFLAYKASNLSKTAQPSRLLLLSRAYNCLDLLLTNRHDCKSCVRRREIGIAIHMRQIAVAALVEIRSPLADNQFRVVMRLPQRNDNDLATVRRPVKIDGSLAEASVGIIFAAGFVLVALCYQQLYVAIVSLIQSYSTGLCREVA
eukprot:scaffold438959_cov18-Prasinocladus_malaysianus.AAC.1